MPNVDPSMLQLRERGVILKGNPMPKGILQSTVDGPRILPLECYTSIRIDPKFSNVYGEVILFSGGGKGQYVGSVRVDYTLLQVDWVKEQMKTLWIPESDDELGDGTETLGTLSGTTSNVLSSDVLRPLWKLEREVYGDKADRLINYDEFKTGLKGWSKPGRFRREESRGGQDNMTW